MTNGKVVTQLFFWCIVNVKDAEDMSLSVHGRNTM